MYKCIELAGCLICLASFLCAALDAQQPVPLHVLEQLQPVEPSSSQLTLARLEQLALEHNPTLAQAAAQIGISQGRALGAGLSPNPSVGYVAEQIGAEGTAGELQGLFVEQEFVTAGKLRLSRAKYASEAQQARLQWEAQHFRVLSSVRRAFYKTLVTQQQVLIREELAKNADEALTTTRGLVNVGQANRPDLLQAEVQKHRIDAERRAAEREYRGHWRAMAAYAGIPDLAPTPLAGQLEVSEADKLDGDRVLQELLQTTPELQAAWAEVERDRLALRREQVEPIPNLLVRGETGYNFETRDAVAGVNIGMRLPVFDKNQGSIMQAKAELARAEADMGRIELTLRRKFGERFGDYEAALERAETLQTLALPKAREAYESYLEAFRNRRAAWPQVLVAQREYFQLTDEYLEALGELRDAEAEITGMFLGDGLDAPPVPEPQGHRESTPRPR
jgi:cobalt-zinc-cadmium efflux system outer membrane protein